MSLAPDLLEILVCPKCKGPLEHRTAPREELVCNTCRLIYAVEDSRSRAPASPQARRTP